MPFRRFSAIYSFAAYAARFLVLPVCALAAFAGRVALDVVVEAVGRGASPFLAAAITLLIACIAAAGQASAAAASAVDVQPYLSNIIELAIYVTGPPIALLAAGLVKRLYDWLGVKRSAERDAAIRAAVDQVLGHAVSFGRAKVGAIGAIPVDMRSPAIAHAAEYAMQAAGATFGKLGIADKASKRLTDMIEARLDAGREWTLFAPAAA